MSQLLANLLLIRNPEKVHVEIKASKAHDTQDIESTLKNMKFKSFVVTSY